MKTVIISPHTDDAIFSLGDFISLLGDVTILSPFAGIPEDKAGREKHILLRKEHHEACIALGANYINGDFLDDVYPPAPHDELFGWLADQITIYDQVIIPLGIFHKDHVRLRNIFMNELWFDGIYTELPYRIAFPEIADELISRYTRGLTLRELQTGRKREAASKYQSQNGSPVMEQIMVKERIYFK